MEARLPTSVQLYSVILHLHRSFNHKRLKQLSDLHET